jgi:hypothetical protein
MYGANSKALSHCSEWVSKQILEKHSYLFGYLFYAMLCRNALSRNSWNTIRIVNSFYQENYHFAFQFSHKVTLMLESLTSNPFKHIILDDQ